MLVEKLDFYGEAIFLLFGNECRQEYDSIASKL